MPEITAAFWLVKLLTTGIGETSSDYLVKSLDPVPVVLAAAVIFGVCFAVQFTARRYVPWRYWLFVTMVAVLGTMVADVAHIVLFVPYEISTIAFALAVAVLLSVWWLSERTISVHSITNARRELFYWSVVLATFALGTALGDLTAIDLGLGFFGSAVMFGALFLLALVAQRLPGAQVALFWVAYMLTRPWGASVADWIAVDRSRGGLAFGTGPVSIIGVVLIAAAVAALQLRSRSGQLARSRLVTSV
ncbi:MAG: hypothetical protein KF761_02520 [Salinibacterium sp.]|nr:hypothetical protein [Salinibacterium sp.]